MGSKYINNFVQILFFQIRYDKLLLYTCVYTRIQFIFAYVHISIFIHIVLIFYHFIRWHTFITHLRTYLSRNGISLLSLRSPVILIFTSTDCWFFKTTDTHIYQIEPKNISAMVQTSLVYTRYGISIHDFPQIILSLIYIINLRYRGYRHMVKV